MPKSRVALPVLCFALAAGCATAKPNAEANLAEGLPPPRVEKVRVPLEVTPLELHFSGVRGSARQSESVAVKNTGLESVQISELRVVGLQPSTFKIVSAPLLPMMLPATGSFSFTVAFDPPADAEPGVHHARVRLILTEEDDGPPCDLTALVSKSKARADEPPLAQIMDALGYDIDVGTTALVLPPGPAGDQVETPAFQRAKPGTVGYYLYARYAGEEASIFGTYTLDQGKPVVRGLGSSARGHNQTLNPDLGSESRSSFDPGEAPFGLYLQVGKRTLYSDPAQNGGAARARVYPLRSRGRTLVPDAYVVAFDEDDDGDFQDQVFMLWNVKPVPFR
jgi:hypothetical protein